jgi:hypothetical protein
VEISTSIILRISFHFLFRNREISKENLIMGFMGYHFVGGSFGDGDTLLLLSMEY